MGLNPILGGFVTGCRVHFVVNLDEALESW